MEKNCVYQRKKLDLDCSMITILDPTLGAKMNLKPSIESFRIITGGICVNQYVNI